MPGLAVSRQSGSDMAQQQEEEEAMEQSLLHLPNDVWQHILSSIDPTDICALGCASQLATRLSSSKRRGVLLARHCGRQQLRAVRHSMHTRCTFVAKACSKEHLSDRETCQADILATLQRSPDPIPDLAAAVQRGLTLVTTQTSLHDALAAPIKADLVRCANFVCLLAWRQHMRKVRSRVAARLAAEAEAAAAAAGAVAGAAGVAWAQGPEQEQEQQQEQGQEQGHQEQEQVQQEQEQQDQEPAAAQPQPGLQAAAVQTELGPSLMELQELLTGLGNLMASSGNPSLRLLRPSLNLLHHLLLRQLQGWNLAQPADQEPVAPVAVGAVAEEAAAVFHAALGAAADAEGGPWG